MIETRNYKIVKRIFTLSDVKKIAIELEKEYKISSRKKHNASLEFTIHCVDDSQYQATSIDLFEENKISPKRVESIDFDFVDYKDDKRISFGLRTGLYSYGNELKISGSDSNWVNGCFVKLKEFIEGAEPQLDIGKYGTLLTVLSSVSVGLIFLFILVTVGRSMVGKSVISPFKLIVDEPWTFLTSIFVMGYFPSVFIVEWLKKIFPSIEIQIGPSYTFIEKNRRKLLIGFITLIIIPIVLSFLFK